MDPVVFFGLATIKKTETTYHEWPQGNADMWSDKDYATEVINMYGKLSAQYEWNPQIHKTFGSAQPK